MPILPTLEDIRKHVGAKGVELATGVDIACLQAESLLCKPQMMREELMPPLAHPSPPSSPIVPPFTYLPQVEPLHIRKAPEDSFIRTLSLPDITSSSLPDNNDSGYVSAAVTPRAPITPSAPRVRSADYDAQWEDASSVSSAESTPSLVFTNGDTPADTPLSSPRPMRKYEPREYQAEGEPTSLRSRIKDGVTKFLGRFKPKNKMY